MYKISTNSPRVSHQPPHTHSEKLFLFPHPPHASSLTIPHKNTLSSHTTDTSSPQSPNPFLFTHNHTRPSFSPSTIIATLTTQTQPPSTNLTLHPLSQSLRKRKNLSSLSKPFVSPKPLHLPHEQKPFISPSVKTLTADGPPSKPSSHRRNRPSVSTIKQPPKPQIRQ